MFTGSEAARAVVVKVQRRAARQAAGA